MFPLSRKSTLEKITLGDIPALRGAFVVAATLILIGVAGVFFVSAWFLLLPIIVSGGLIFSATFGWCPMAALVEHIVVKKK